MKKFVNVRLPVIVALLLCCGIGLGILLYFYKQSVAWATLALVPAAIILPVFYLVKRKFVVKPLVYTLLPLILFIGGALNSYYFLARFDKSEISESATYSIRGDVKEKGETASGEYIIITNIMLNNVKISGDAYVYLAPTYGELCEEGYKINFIGALEKIEPFQYGEVSRYTEQNVKYRSEVYSGLQSTYGYSFFGSIRSAMRNTMFSNLDQNTAAISYAMLTGNTEQVDEASLESFRYGGIAHIFAVSGLHIGIIFGIISFIFKKLRINIYVSAAISVAAIFLYSALCGFTVSSLRAAIMCTVATIANLSVERYDGLNSLAVAVIIILSITPMSLVTVGFQLSVCAVGGIYCFSKCIEKLLRKIKIPQKISSAIGVSFGAQLGTLPILLSNFGYISGAGLLLNIVVIPALSVVFVIIFVSVIICSLIGAIAPFIIPYAALPLQFTISLFIGAGFENSLISGFGAGIFVPVYFLFILGISDKLNLKAPARIITVACGIAVLTTYVLVSYGAPFSGYKMIISAYGSGGEVVIKSSQGTALIVTDKVTDSRLKSMLGRNYVTGIDALIVLGDDNLDVYPTLTIDVPAIYIANSYPQIQPYGDITVTYSDSFSVCGVDFFFYDNNTLLATVGGVDIGVCTDQNFSINRCDIMISDLPAAIDFKTQVYLTNRDGPLNVFDCGDIIYSIKNGAYSLQNKLPPA